MAVLIGNIELPDFPLLLAPMEDVSDPPFRYVCKQHGADLMYSEFISSEVLIRDAIKSRQKLDFFEYERPFGIQLFGGDEEAMGLSARIIDATNPDLVDINRMYRRRDFEFIGISADEPAKKNKALQFLQKSAASNTNYIFNADDKYQLIDAVDPKWQGALPYTLLVEPGGKIVYSREGPIDPQALKTAIVADSLIGRYY